jgi:protoporphyrinogen oxidase
MILMRDVVIIGGGLSGLAAAYELEKHDINYTLIEVKRQLGGSIQTVEKKGARMDLGAFALANTFDEAWLASLELDQAIYQLSNDAVAFTHGTGVLIDALAAKISAPRMMRMAVSSIGELDNGRFSICMENGLMLDAGALIIAIPARYAERLFYGYITPISAHLLDYHYDTIQRISMTVSVDALTNSLIDPPDMGYVFNHYTTHPDRVPQGSALIQFGLRLTPETIDDPQQMVALLQHAYQLPEPQALAMSYWAEADPVSCYDDDHHQWVDQLRSQIPDGIEIIGSDYSLTPPQSLGVVNLQERITQGQHAAQTIMTYLKQ